MTRNIIQIYLLSYKYVLRLKEIEKKKTPLFIYFGYYSLIDHITCKHFLPIQQVVFHSVNGFLCSTKGLSLIRLHLFTFAFVSFGFWCQINKNTAKTDVNEITTYVFFQEFNDFRSYIQVFNSFRVNFACCVSWFHLFACENPIFLPPFIEETVISPLFCSFVVN